MQVRLRALQAHMHANMRSMDCLLSTTQPTLINSTQTLRGVLEKQPDERRVTIVVGIPGYGSQVFTEALAVSHAYDSKINENIVVIHVMPEVN